VTALGPKRPARGLNAEYALVLAKATTSQAHADVSLRVLRTNESRVLRSAKFAVERVLALLLLSIHRPV
jgi:curli biogenesis system outer membrane secretion channel CsgG